MVSNRICIVASTADWPYEPGPASTHIGNPTCTGAGWCRRLHRDQRRRTGYIRPRPYRLRHPSASRYGPAFALDRTGRRSSRTMGVQFRATAIAAAPALLIANGDHGAISILAPLLFVVANLVIVGLTVMTLSLLLSGKMFALPQRTEIRGEVSRTSSLNPPSGLHSDMYTSEISPPLKSLPEHRHQMIEERSRSNPCTNVQWNAIQLLLAVENIALHNRRHGISGTISRITRRIMPRTTVVAADGVRSRAVMMETSRVIAGPVSGRAAILRPFSAAKA